MQGFREEWSYAYDATESDMCWGRKEDQEEWVASEEAQERNTESRRNKTDLNPAWLMKRRPLQYVAVAVTVALSNVATTDSNLKVKAWVMAIH